MFASLGSMIDVTFGDLIDFLGDDEDTRSILLYMEQVGDAKNFMSAARAFAMRKPIVVLKPARPMATSMAPPDSYRRLWLGTTRSTRRSSSEWE